MNIDYQKVLEEIDKTNYFMPDSPQDDNVRWIKYMENINIIIAEQEQNIYDE